MDIQEQPQSSVNFTAIRSHLVSQGYPPILAFKAAKLSNTIPQAVEWLTKEGSQLIADKQIQMAHSNPVISDNVGVAQAPEAPGAPGPPGGPGPLAASAIIGAPEARDEGRPVGNVLAIVGSGFGGGNEKVENENEQGSSVVNPVGQSGVAQENKLVVHEHPVVRENPVNAGGQGSDPWAASSAVNANANGNPNPNPMPKAEPIADANSNPSQESQPDLSTCLLEMGFTEDEISVCTAMCTSVEDALLFIEESRTTPPVTLEDKLKLLGYRQDVYAPLLQVSVGVEDAVEIINHGVQKGISTQQALQEIMDQQSQRQGGMGQPGEMGGGMGGGGMGAGMGPPGGMGGAMGMGGPGGPGMPGPAGMPGSGQGSGYQQGPQGQ